MSDSRLEKFIYAICSMDVSDLPVPLSRIETLWNCLITGETPDFEPLSRNEKYLMAMLDRYDISNLPAPMSRGEKLLYKIAVGETDLSDVPGYLSRYEELLKYLIENGGISGGDFEYVLYTLNQAMYTLYTTAEKPVKNAILKGQTLINLAVKTDVVFTKGGDWKKSGINQNLLDTSKKYLISFFSSCNYNGYVHLRNATQNAYITSAQHKSFNKGNNKILIDSFLETDLTNFTNINLVYFVDSSATEFPTLTNIMLLEYQEGMENWDIPYFEGMQSVQAPGITMTGKNLIDKQTLMRGYIDEDGLFQTNTTDLASDYIRILSNTNYTYKVFTDLNYGMRFTFFDENKSMIYRTDSFSVTNGGCKTYESPSGAYYVRIHSNSFDNIGFDADVSLVMGDTPLAVYEPFKSITLSTPSDLELRKVGDMEDELDCLTGEVTERIGEIVLDGSDDENWKRNSANDGNDTAVFYIPNVLNRNAELIMDKFASCTVSNFWVGEQNDSENHLNNSSEIAIRISKSKLSSIDVSGFRQWLSQNPVTVQHTLMTDSIKTVDLNVVDQDNQPAKLGTFENLTHVSLESAGLIPEVEMEVATNLLEDTVFNLTNAFNTLYPTAAKPVVDGTLYGQTLVNIIDSIETAAYNYTDYELSFIDKTKTYFIKFNSAYTLTEIGFIVSGGEWNVVHTNVKLTNGYIKLKPDESKAIIALRMRFDQNRDTSIIPTVDVVCIEYQDGMENWDIPYFEGMQSVKMPVLTTTGKNLFNLNSMSNINDWDTDVSPEIPYCSYKINLKPNTTYTFSQKQFLNPEEDICASFGLEKGAYEYLLAIIHQSNQHPTTFSFTTDDRGLIYVKLWQADKHLDGFISNLSSNELQLEEGTEATTYEPYKSTTLTTPSDLELRKVGEVQDEVNVMTGEVVERIGEVILNGQENWRLCASGYQPTNTNYINYDLDIDDIKTSASILCDTIKVRDWTVGSTALNSRSIAVHSTNKILRLCIEKTIAPNVESLQTYLSTNTAKVQYQLKASTTKTVDLSVVNQDGNETKLRTFDDTTHVLLNSEGLIHTASLTVRTKIPSASSTSLLMDDISNEQQQLSDTVDEQSNNVDATMIATTEIYEETL